MTEPATSRTPRTGLLALIEGLRPTHWTKNAFVLAPLFFAGQFDRLAAWAEAGLATAAFCLLSSAIYLFNDLADLEADRLHPDKKGRPLASGRLSRPTAIAGVVVLLAMGMALSWAPQVLTCGSANGVGRTALPVVAGAYVVINILYSLWLKHRTIIDVILVAGGFVLRAVGGAAAIAVPISPWLVLCTFMLCLYIALAKRRAELIHLPDDLTGKTRRAIAGYDEQELSRLLSISAAMALMAYSLYCLAPRTVSHIGSAHMIWTIPLVTFGLFRFDRLSRREHGGDVVNILLADRVLWLTVVLYLVMVVAIVQYGRRPAVRDLLDADAAVPRQTQD